LLAVQMRSHENLKIPRPVFWLLFFLVSYLASIAMNAGNYPIQRIFASLNNYLTYLMGFAVILVIYHADFKFLLYAFLRTCRILCFISGLISVIFLVIWWSGHSDVQFPSLLGRFLPSLSDYPFFSIF